MYLSKALLLMFIGVLTILICCLEGCIVSKRGEVIESWETTNGYFKIRAVAYREDINWGLHGAYYVFSSSMVKENVWTEIMEFRHDDDPPIPRDNIRFINDQIGYIFMGTMYTVTTDTGKTWSIWNAVKDIPDRRWYRNGYISDIRLSLDGNGVMTYHGKYDPGKKDFVDIQLYTNDFGRRWNRNP